MRSCCSVRTSAPASPERSSVRGANLPVSVAPARWAMAMKRVESVAPQPVRPPLPVARLFGEPACHVAAMAPSPPRYTTQLAR